MTKADKAPDPTPETPEDTGPSIEPPPAKFAKTAPSDDRIRQVLPEDLVMACSPERSDGTPNPFYHGDPFGPENPLYRPSADASVLDLTPGAEAMASFGWAGGVVEARKEGSCLVIEDGRTRTHYAYLANQLRAAKGWKGPTDPILVKVVVVQDDDLSSFVKGTLLNRFRRRSNALEEAAEIVSLRTLGLKDKKQIALLFGWTGTDTVNLRLKLLEAADEVKQALQAGTITNSDAIKLASLPPDKQVRKLALIPKKLPDEERRTPEASKKAKAVAQDGKRGKARKPSETQIAQILDEIQSNPDTTAYNVLRYAAGLLGIAKAAEALGLSKESPVYRHLKDRENAAKDAQ
jgi:ParB-like chromosome segregation protein Spo0J